MKKKITTLIFCISLAVFLMGAGIVIVNTPTASQVSVTPVGGVSATNVQSAIQELDAAGGGISASDAVEWSNEHTFEIGLNTNLIKRITSLAFQKVNLDTFLTIAPAYATGVILTNSLAGALELVSGSTLFSIDNTYGISATGNFIATNKFSLGRSVIYSGTNVALGVTIAPTTSLVELDFAADTNVVGIAYSALGQLILFIGDTSTVTIKDSSECGGDIPMQLDGDWVEAPGATLLLAYDNILGHYYEISRSPVSPTAADDAVTVTYGESITAGDQVAIDDSGVAWKVEPSHIIGAPQSIFTSVSSSTTGYGAAWDTTDTCIISTYYDGTKSYAIAGTVSGSTISWGSPVEFNTGTSTTAAVAYNAEAFVISYPDGGNSSKMTSIVGTVSGTTITFGSEWAYGAAAGSNVSSVGIGSSEVCIYWTESTACKAKIITVDAAARTMTGGTIATVAAATTVSSGVTWADGTIVFAYQDNTPANAGYFQGYLIGAAVAGAILSLGTPNAYTDATHSVSANSCSFPVWDPHISRMITVYQDNNNYNRLTANIATVSGTTITNGTPAVVCDKNAGNTVQKCFVYDESNEVVVGIVASDSAYYGVGSRAILQLSATTSVVTPSSLVIMPPTSASMNLNANNSSVYLGAGKIFFSGTNSLLHYDVSSAIATFSKNPGYLGDKFSGFANETAASGSHGVHVHGSTDANQAALVPGVQYYSNWQTGALETTVGPYPVGTALSATSIRAK